MTQILDLDDCAMSLFVDGKMLYSEPAAAFDTQNGITFGSAATSQSRIHPRRVNQSYLSRLNAEPLAQSFHQARNHADLLYHHLRFLAEAHPSLIRDPVLVTVRSTTTAEQLGLVLGVATEAGLRVGAFVDRGMAVVASSGLPSDLISLEVCADHGEICHANLNFEATRIRLQEFAGQGLNQIQDGWVNIIADHFIRNSRFDPLRSAGTEQQLYDMVRAWFKSGESQGRITIEHQQEMRGVELGVDALRRKLQERLAPMLTELTGNSVIVLGPNACNTPLLASVLRQSGFTVHGQHRATVLAYVEREVSALVNPDEVRFLTTLPLAPRTQAGDGASASQPLPPLSTVAAKAPAPNKAIPGRPTHGLHSTTAYPIGGPDLPAELVGEDPRSGVTIDINGRLFTLIEVRS